MDRRIIGIRSAALWIAGAWCVWANPGHASALPPIQRVDAGVQVEPVRVARVHVNGTRAELIGEWHEYAPFHGRSQQKCIFDCFGWDWIHEIPDGGGCAGAGKYSFGETFNDPYCADDLTGLDTSATQWSSLKAAWIWYVNGPGSSEHCFLYFLLGPDANFAACPDPDADGHVGELEGVVVDFGVLNSSSGLGYYSTSVDLEALGIPWPAGVGSHVLIQSKGTDSAGNIRLASTGQFMLWGTPDAVPVPPPGSCGAQVANALDDTSPTDFNLTPLSECSSYDLSGGCPVRLGKAVAYGQPGRCKSDFDGDGFVTGDDFDGYVAAFEVGNIAADFNRDGFVTGDDFDGYVAAFEAGC